MMIRFLLLFFFFTSFAGAREVLVVVGLEGADEYRETFKTSAESWEKACQKANVPCQIMGIAAPMGSDSSVKEKLEKKLSEIGEKELWLILIGHGTFDGRSAKFNIPGKDFTSGELAEWCKGITGDLVLVNTASASAPFIKALAGKNRTIISATKSANEIFYARFGSYFSTAVTGIKEADLDNDDQVSLLEAFLFSADQVAQFYNQEGRLSTEHALIDDNGDGLGTRAEWFEGTTATKVAKTGAQPDGLRAMQQVLVENDLEKDFPPDLRKRRDELETRVRVLRRKKSKMAEADYYRDLEKLLRELAHIYQKAEKAGESDKG